MANNSIGEPKQNQLFVYAFILATIPLITIFIKYTFIGDVSNPEGNIIQGLEYGGYYFISSIVLVYILAWFVDLRSLSNNSNKDFGRSLQLIIYSFTPYWIAGFIYIFGVEYQSIVQLIGLYSIYLIYLGLSPIKQTPSDNVVSYMINIVIGMLVLRFVLGILPAYIL